MFEAIGRVLARTSVQRVAVICTVFATVLSAGAYATSDQFGLMHWLRSYGHGYGQARQSDPPTGVAGLSNDDPVKNFTKTGVGHVLFATTDSDSCRRTLFDNRTGATYEAGEVLCAPVPEAQNERLQSLSKPFKRQ